MIGRAARLITHKLICCDAIERASHVVSLCMPKPLLALGVGRFVTPLCDSSRIVIVPADIVLTWPRIIRECSVQGSTSKRLHLISDTHTGGNMTIPAKRLSFHAIYEAVALPPFKSVSVRNNFYLSASIHALYSHRLIGKPKYISICNQTNPSITSYTIPSLSISTS